MPADLSTRIKNIQKQLAVPQTGTIDQPTCMALENRIGITVNSTNLTTHIKNIQRALKTDDDGLIGPITISRIEALIATKLPPIPQGGNMVASIKSLDLIIASEVTSKETYTKKYQSPTWPGGASGITIGIGFDIGYCSKQDFTNAWQMHLPVAAYNTLLSLCGKKGESCKALIPGLSSIKVPYDIAIKIFYHTTLPACARDVKKAYPGVDKLPPDAQGALLSLIYNRGPLIDNSDRRKEMKAMVPLVAAGNLQGIAQQIRNMKRLWDATKQKGLIIRREKEASLVEHASFDVLPEDMVVI